MNISNNYYGGKRGASPSQLAKAREARGKTSAKNCKWSNKTLRCRRSGSGGVSAHCRINRKGRCVKKSSSPKRVVTSTKQLSALAKGRVRRAANIASKKGVAISPPPMPRLPKNTHQTTSALSVELAKAQCAKKTDAQSCNKAVNCSWTEAHEKKNRRGEKIKIAANCGHHRGKAVKVNVKQAVKLGKVQK